MKTLGLDLGSNSLGWAILDDSTGNILNKGVVIFPDGIDPAKDSLETPAATRRAARMGRRIKFRRKIRKWHLLKILIETGMCPLRMEELEAWKKDGKYPLNNQAFLDWLKATDLSNPYCDRNAAAEGKVSPLTLGRALYHICQRRGFKSSRKDATSDSEDEATNKKAEDKRLGKVKGDIASLSKAIQESKSKTLGQYFFKKLENQKGALSKERIRGHYTGRIEHYQHEFDVIMDTQGINPSKDPHEKGLRERLYDAIFYQRPLRSQSFLVGQCPLEHHWKKAHNPRALISHPAVEEFRMLAFVNNLSFDDRNNNRVALTPADRKLACTAFMKAAPSIKFEDISKLFKKDPRFKYDGYRFHHYNDEESIPSCSLRHRLRKFFGDISYDEQKVFDALTFFDSDEKLTKWFKKHYPQLNDDAIGHLVRIHPREGNAKYSLKAINRILPFLRCGYELSHARFLARLPDVIEDFDNNKEEIINGLNGIHFEYLSDKQRIRNGEFKQGERLVPLYDRYQDYLLTKWNVTADKWQRLYLKGDSAYDKDEIRIPKVELGMIRNPLVQRAMTTLRRLVNYLRDHDQIDATTTIRIELARTVNDRATRQAWQKWQEARAEQREHAREEILKHNVAATEDAIERYVLSEEQDFTCLYTGRTIDIKDILEGNIFDIEHTIPRSRSGDNSLANKTICEAKYNRETKKGRIPHECSNWASEIDRRLDKWREKVKGLEKNYLEQKRSAQSISDPAARSNARIKALKTKFELDYWRDKVGRFDATPEKLQDPEGGLNGFKKRQLVDTGIMCSHAVELLRSVYPKVYSVNGAATAFARKAWGIQGDDQKDRSEHTHHAKDAMVIAALTPTRFNAICAALKDDGQETGKRRLCDICPSPWPDFAERVRRATNEILVKHVQRQTTLRQSSKRTALAKAHPPKGDLNAKSIKFVLAKGDTVRGQLHQDTFYGCIQKPDGTGKAFVVRKTLIGKLPDALKLVKDIIDPAIRNIVSARLDELSASGAKNVEPGDIRMPSGVPINKVRIKAQTTNPNRLRDHVIPSLKDYKTPYYVTSAGGSNFRMGIFNTNGKLSAIPDNSLNWAQNHKKSDYRPLDKQPGFIGYVMPGIMALAYHKGHPEEVKTLTPTELQKRLYKVVKFDNTGRITFRFHREARASVVLKKALGAKGKHEAGESKIDIHSPHELLLLSTTTYMHQMLFEGIHFKMMLDGTIKFLF